MYRWDVGEVDSCFIFTCGSFRFFVYSLEKQSKHCVIMPNIQQKLDIAASYIFLIEYFCHCFRACVCSALFTQLSPVHDTVLGGQLFFNSLGKYFAVFSIGEYNGISAVFSSLQSIALVSWIVGRPIPSFQWDKGWDSKRQKPPISAHHNEETSIPQQQIDKAV